MKNGKRKKGGRGIVRSLVYTNGSLRARARYPEHVQSAPTTYCHVLWLTEHFNISAESASRTRVGILAEREKERKRVLYVKKDNEACSRYTTAATGLTQRFTRPLDPLYDLPAAGTTGRNYRREVHK